MVDFKPDRLGHCCFLDGKQLEEVATLGIPVEVCPSSNLAVVTEACGTVAGLKHIRKLRESGHNHIVCADDTMLFSTNISTELFEYCNAFGVQGDELKALLKRNVDAIFDEKCKEELATEIESYRV